MNTRTIITSQPQKCFAGHNIYYSWKGENSTVVEVDTFRSNKFLGPDDEGYRPSSVKVNGIVVWDFKYSGIRPFADLIWVDDEKCPMIVGMNSKYVLSVLPTQDFETAQTVIIAGTTKLVGGSSVERLLDLKIAIANGLGLEADFTKNEQILVQQRIDAEREARLARERERVEVVDTKRSERLAARVAFAQDLLSRKIMVAYTATGDVRKGLPVTEDEFPRLIGNRHYIVIDEGGAPIRCFLLTDSKKKLGEMPVSAIKPELKLVQTEFTVSAETEILVRLGGVATEVPLYKNSADVSIARKAWRLPLVVAYREYARGQATGRTCVVRASQGGCDDIMVVKTQQEAIAA